MLIRNGEVVYANAACLSIFGISGVVVLDTPTHQCLRPEFLSAALSLAARAEAGDPHAQVELDYLDDLGIQRSYRLSACCADDNGRPATLLVATDITKYRRVRYDLEKLNRSLRVLSEADNALIHQRHEDALLQSTCVSLVKTGQHSFAWAGYVSGTGAESTVLPAAAFGVQRKAVSKLAAMPSAKHKLLTPTSTAILHGQPVVVADSRTETQFALSRLACKRYLSSIDVPIRDGSSTLGVLSIYDSAPGRFGPEEIVLMSKLADNLAYGIKSIRNRVALQQALNQTNSLSRQVMRSQEQARQHLSREIHDQLGSLTTGILMSVNQCEQVCTEIPDNGIAAVKELVLELIHGVRNLSQTLRPPMLDDFGLLPTVEWYVEKFGERTGVQVDLRHRGIGQRMDPDLEITIFRLLQEGLTNIARHAHTDSASVSILVGRGQVHLTVQDHGRGFDLAAIQRTTTSTGLAGMRERAALLGGTLTIETAPGSGAKLIAVIPTIQMNKGELLW